MHALWDFVLIGVLVVVLPDIVIADIHAGNIRCADRDVARLPLLRN